MASGKEVEIKFQIEDTSTLARALRAAGFRVVTKRTPEMNTLYDLPGQQLRKRGEILRLRKYGPRWVLTHKAKGTAARHKSRVESETEVEDGRKLEAILSALGFRPVFRYEKFRAEWSDGKGHVVIDQTPIGNFGEIEGPPHWIDRTARALGIGPSSYISQSYGELFQEWKRRTASRAQDMTFNDVRRAKARR